MIDSNDKAIWLSAALWMCLASGALFAMADYGAQAGDGADPPNRWPDSIDNFISAESGKPTLVLFAHPLCPCTRASLWELEGIANRLFGLFNTHILFYEPEDKSGMEEIWQASGLKAIASRLPGATLHVDLEGKLAEHFGAYTSGQVLLYDSNKLLRFAGGITPSRGHTGTNPGRATVISSILSDSAVDPLLAISNPVYGCSLHADDQAGDRKLKISQSGLL